MRCCFSSTCNFWVSSLRILMVFLLIFMLTDSQISINAPKRIPPEPSLYPCLLLVQPLPSSLPGSSSHFLQLVIVPGCLACWKGAPHPKSQPSPLWKCPSVHLKLDLGYPLLLCAIAQQDSTGMAGNRDSQTDNLCSWEI